MRVNVPVLKKSKFYPENGTRFGNGPCFFRVKRRYILVIAIASENNQVAAYGGTPEFTIFKVEGTRQREREVVPMKRLFGVDLAKLLVKMEIDLVICKAIDSASKRALSEAGIHLVAGASGSVDAVYKGYLAGELEFSVY